MARRRRLSVWRRAAGGTSLATIAWAALSSGWVRSGTCRCPLHEPNFFAVRRERVTLVELAAAALLGLAVDGHLTLGEQLLRLPARPDDPGDLERLPEPDGVAPDLKFPHAPDGSV